MPLNRREMCLLLPATTISLLRGAEALSPDENVLPSSTFLFEKLPVKASDNAEIRAILKGKLETGESLEVHETTLQPGGAPHPPHHHEHSEMWLIREGTVDLPSMASVAGSDQVDWGLCIRWKSTESRMWEQRRRPTLLWPWDRERAASCLPPHNR